MAGLIMLAPRARVYGDAIQAVPISLPPKITTIAIEAKSGGGLAVGAGFKYLPERMRFPLALRVGLGTTGHVVSPSINGTPVHCLPADQFLAALV